MIASLVLAVVPPRLSGAIAHAELKGAARELAAGLRTARSQAIAGRREVALVVDVEGRRFSIPGGREVRLAEGVRLSAVTARSEAIGKEQGMIRFFPDGSSTGGRITLSNGGQRYTVDVDWLTGRVSFLD